MKVLFVGIKKEQQQLLLWTSSKELVQGVQGKVKKEGKKEV